MEHDQTKLVVQAIYSLPESWSFQNLPYYKICLCKWFNLKFSGLIKADIFTESIFKNSIIAI